MIKINVCNKYTHKLSPEDIALDVYIGRGSPFDNPFPINAKQSRDVVCDAYDHMLYNSGKGLKIREHIEEVIKTAENLDITEINLICYCAPKRCHGETIKKYIENYLYKQEN